MKKNEDMKNSIKATHAAMREASMHVNLLASKLEGQHAGSLVAQQAGGQGYTLRAPKVQKQAFFLSIFYNQIQKLELNLLMRLSKTARNSHKNLLMLPVPIQKLIGWHFFETITQKRFAQMGLKVNIFIVFKLFVIL